MIDASTIMINGDRGRVRCTSLKLGYRQVLTIRKPRKASRISHSADQTHHWIGTESAANTMAATMAAAAGIGRPTKYLRSGRPGFLGIGFVCTLKRASLAAPQSRKRKLTKYPMR